jgi:hypothetical protein
MEHLSLTRARMDLCVMDLAFIKPHNSNNYS